MDLNDLFEELKKKEFQNPDSGNLFFPAYIYTYDPTKEYELREEVKHLHERLKRPNVFQDLLVLNIYEEFINYLKTEKLGDESLFDLFVNQEKEGDTKEAAINLRDSACSSDFLLRIDKKIKEHFHLPSSLKKVYVLVHGFGSIFPYLRASEFLKKFEEYVSGGGYKIIVLYPGKFENNHFKLFNEINNENIYRASLLNK